MNTDKKTAYMKVYETLKTAIAKDYAPGDLLPPEPQLEEGFGVSRITIRHAMQLLAAEGYVSIRQGRGTMVTIPGAQRSANPITSTTEVLMQAGYNVKTLDTYVDTVIPDASVLKNLWLPEDMPVTRLQRIFVGNGRPFSLITNYLNPEMVPELAKHKKELGSLYHLLETHYGLVLDYATDDISATGASLEQARTLSVPIGSPLIHIRRVLYSKERPISCSDMLADAARCKFRVYLSGRPAQEEPAGARA
jgi:GntR family transcriptional regulator